MPGMPPGVLTLDRAENVGLYKNPGTMSARGPGGGLVFPFPRFFRALAEEVRPALASPLERPCPPPPPDPGVVPGKERVRNDETPILTRTGVVGVVESLAGEGLLLERLGFADDERDYAVAAHMLMSLKIQSVQLMTNNPKKINQLEQYGIHVAGRIPHIMEPNEHNLFYLETKAAKSGHMIDFRGKQHLYEQSDRPIVEGMSEDQIGALNEQ